MYRDLSEPVTELPDDVLEFLKKYPANTIDGIKTEMRELVNNEG